MAARMKMTDFLGCYDSSLVEVDGHSEASSGRSLEGCHLHVSNRPICDINDELT